MQTSPQNRCDGARWLVLGAAGFVGKAITAELKMQKRNVTGMDRSGSAHSQAIDVFDDNQLRTALRKLRPDFLVNAVGHPQGLSGIGLIDFYVRSTKNILEAVQFECPACRVVLLGSASEYGNTIEAGACETDALKPLSDYGRAKCGQFELSRQLAQSGSSITTARLFNILGPGQRVNLFPQALMERIGAGESPARVANGHHIRDWVDVRDAVRAVIMAVESPEPPELFNVCTGQGTPVGSLAREIGSLSGSAIVAECGETSSNQLWRSIGNPGKIFGLSWRPRFSLTQSLADQWKACP